MRIRITTLAPGAKGMTGRQMHTQRLDNAPLWVLTMTLSLFDLTVVPL